MRRFFLVLTLIGGLLWLTQVDASAHHGPPYLGEYEAFDVVDESKLTLEVVGDHRYQKLRFYDNGGSVCHDAGLGFVPARFDGPVEPTGRASFAVTGDVQCRTARGWTTVTGGMTLEFAYSTGPDRLTDSTGQVYFRR